MKTYVFIAKNHSATITISAEDAFKAIDELEEVLKQDDVNDYRLDEEGEEEDGHEELPHGNEHWNEEKIKRHSPFGVIGSGLTKASDINQQAKEKRPTPEDFMHITPELKAQLDKVSKNRYFTPDEKTKNL